MAPSFRRLFGGNGDAESLTETSSNASGSQFSGFSFGSSSGKVSSVRTLNFNATAPPNSRRLLFPVGTTDPVLREREGSSSSSVNEKAYAPPSSRGSSAQKKRRSLLSRLSKQSDGAETREMRPEKSPDNDKKKLDALLRRGNSGPKGTSDAAESAEADRNLLASPPSADGFHTSSELGLTDGSDDLAQLEGIEHLDIDDTFRENGLAQSPPDGDTQSDASQKVRRWFRSENPSEAPMFDNTETPVVARQRTLQRKALYQPQDIHMTTEELKDDIETVRRAELLFLNSQMIDAEEIELVNADHCLYSSVGYTLLQCIKSLMTYEPDDLESAIECCKETIQVTASLRKPDSVVESVGRLARGAATLQSIQSMTFVQVHAELVFAEATLLKAVLAIIYSGDFLAFLKEAFNVRNAYAVYRSLSRYIEKQDEDGIEVDQDLRSGVLLGNGAISLVLSLLPSSLLSIISTFGVSGSRQDALRQLMEAGGWEPGVKRPKVSKEKEGIRRPICDMVLLLHHLVVSSYLPMGAPDMDLASNILDFHLKRFPSGVFFLYFSGRLYSCRTLGDEAIAQFKHAIHAQKEYIQLHHICHWDLALVFLAMGRYEKAYECFNILNKESNWSKAIYAYAKAISLYEAIDDADDLALAQPTRMLSTVAPLVHPSVLGKTIPLEKFVARRAIKFLRQGNRLLCPGIELAYFLNCLQLSPRYILYEVHLDQVSILLADLHQVKNPELYGAGDEFWDDYCLAHLMRAVILRYIAHPDPSALTQPPDSPIPIGEADQQALISLKNVIRHGKRIVSDHFLMWFARYELGALHAAMANYEEAATQFNMVLQGRGLETTRRPKERVELQSMCVMRCNAALESLKEQNLV